MLLQLGLTIVMTVKSMTVSSLDNATSMLDWTSYLMLANLVATSLLFAGVASSIGELKRVGMSISGLLVALVGFAVATAALAWTYHVFSELVDILLNLDSESSLERLEAATKDAETLKFVAIAKDVGYGLGLISVLRMVQVQAAANDQLAMRDDAGHMRRAIMMMLAGDIFYQLTYGLGGGVGFIGAVGALLLGGYWIWCHLKLVRFFENAAHFMNEPHDLPLATAVKVPEVKDLKPKPAPRTSRPSLPSMPSSPSSPSTSSAPLAPSQTPDAATPPPMVIVQPPPPPVPRAPSATAEGDAPAGDGPKFLR